MIEQMPELPAIIPAMLEHRAIRSDSELKEAINSRAFAKEIERGLEEARVRMKRPYLEGTRTIDAKFRPLLELCGDAVKHLDRLMLAWKQAEADRYRIEAERISRENEKRRANVEAENKLLQEEAKKHEVNRALAAGAFKFEAEELALHAEPETQIVAYEQPAPLRPRNLTRSELGSITLRTFWDFEIVDPLLVPSAYLIPNELAIRADIRLGIREISGIRIFERDVISGTAAKKE